MTYLRSTRMQRDPEHSQRSSDAAFLTAATGGVEEEIRHKIDRGKDAPLTKEPGRSEHSPSIEQRPK